MKISLTKAGKRFNRDWIFRNVTYEFTAGNAYAITGPNGSGKSTLLQVIGGAIAMSEGKTEYRQSAVGSRESVPPAGGMNRQPETGNLKPEASNADSIIPNDDAFRYLAIAAPYLDLIEEMTATEFLSFHTQFKPFLAGIDNKKALSIIGLEKAANKQIRYFSSGMKQRVKLAQAIFSDVSCLLLDEPCTNLDLEGIGLYQQLVHEYCADRLVIVSSNDVQEYGFCKEQISILDYK
jgi:ABC-type multidrug transport system ATPase subunit